MSSRIAQNIALGFVWLSCTHTGLSQGTIVYSQPSSPIILWYQNGTTITGYHPMDVDGDGTTDFTFVYSPTFLGVRSERANRILIRLSPPPDLGGPITPLPAGFQIGSGSSLDPLSWWAGFDGDFDPLGIYLNGGGSGDFVGQRAYMGIEFQHAGNTHYGWALLQVGSFGPFAAIESWAWETRSGVPIFAGAGVPEPSAFALFSVAGIMLLALRRLRCKLPT